MIVVLAARICLWCYDVGGGPLVVQVVVAIVSNVSAITSAIVFSKSAVVPALCQVGIM